MNGADGGYPWFLSDGGACGTLARSTDWSKTPLGPPASWSPTLRTMARSVLGSVHPMLLCWGPELVQLYNDALLPTIAKLGRHPRAMGQRASECWREAWSTAGPELAGVMRDGRGRRCDDRLVPIPHEGRPEETWTFSVSPVFEADGTVGGALVVCSESAKRVLAVFHAQNEDEVKRGDLLRQAPVAAIFSVGREQRIELTNQAFIEILGRDPTGETLVEAFPGIVGTDLQRKLDDAYTTGEAFGICEQQITLSRGRSPEKRWFKFNVQPVRHRDGAVYGMMAIAIDITDTIATRNELEAYAVEREKLLHAVEAASRAKDEFLAMLGHELRNPLAPITTALHLMKLKEPAALAREREIIARQTTHLTRLVDDILDVARVSRGKVTLDRTRVALADVIGRAVETAGPLFEQKRHTLTVDVPSKGLDVEGDALRLGQVFANLLANAAKFTPPGGTISATAERDGDVAVVRVEDNGIGIPPDQLARVFDVFYQEARSYEVSQGGLGLGLALVKSFVSLHGGTVTVMNRPCGGSTFEVRLPALPPTAESTADAHVEPTMSDEEASDGKRVLLVDDSDDMLEIVGSFLRFAGYEVMATHDAPSALRLAPSFRPNVAVLDIGLPDMDGYDLAAHLREELGDRAPRMIAMTGYGREADRERALRAGFAAHLVKPVDPQALLASVRAIARG